MFVGRVELPEGLGDRVLHHKVGCSHMQAVKPDVYGKPHAGCGLLECGLSSISQRRPPTAASLASASGLAVWL